jgi:hypothetical protein
MSGVNTHYMDTQSIQLRTVPVDVARILKSRAALKGVTLEKYVTDLVSKAALAKDGKTK